MDIRHYNREAWNRLVASENRWTVPVDDATIRRARTGRLDLLLTPVDMYRRPGWEICRASKSCAWLRVAVSRGLCWPRPDRRSLYLIIHQPNCHKTSISLNNMTFRC